MLSVLLDMLPDRVRIAYYRRAGARIGTGSTISRYVLLFHPRRFVMGTNSGINRFCYINACGTIRIGDNVLIGPYTMIHSKNHFQKQREVRIGDNVWIGAYCIVLPGASVPDNSILPAGTIWTRTGIKERIIQ